MERIKITDVKKLAPAIQNLVNYWENKESLDATEQAILADIMDSVEFVWEPPQ